MISATTRRAKTIDYMVASAFVQFARGDGSDYINAQGRVDFDAGIAAADLDVVRAGTSYELRLGGGDVLTLQGAMAVRFADGENWTADDLIARARWEATPFADTYEGTDGNDVADGLAGNDFLNGQGGDDTLTGGDGADSIDGGPGHDVLMGGTGADWLAGRDGNDILDGGADNDQLLGEAGADNLRGGSGSDVLSGGDGDDLFDTGVGTVDQDTVIGGRGNDTVNAYGNQDTFSFARGDGQDVINTSRLGNNVFANLAFNRHAIERGVISAWLRSTHKRFNRAVKCVVRSDHDLRLFPDFGRVAIARNRLPPLLGFYLLDACPDRCQHARRASTEYSDGWQRHAAWHRQ